MTDLATFLFGIAALIGICWFAIRAGLLERGQVDRYEDGEQSDRDAQAIIDASRPAPLTWDSAYVKRPHIRAGEKP